MDHATLNKRTISVSPYKDLPLLRSSLYGEFDYSGSAMAALRSLQSN
ncbi:hypothetical protein [Paenibacillus jiagnxiensis]